MKKPNNNEYNDRPFAFTAMSGEFPSSPGIDALWQRIVKAEVAPLVSLEKRWQIARSIYYDPQPGKAGYIYLDKAFCLPEITALRGRQVAYACRVIKRLIDPLIHEGKAPDLSTTGLVLAVCWSDEEYYMADMEYFLKKDVQFDKPKIKKP